MDPSQALIFVASLTGAQQIEGVGALRMEHQRLERGADSEVPILVQGQAERDEVARLLQVEAHPDLEIVVASMKQDIPKELVGILGDRRHACGLAVVPVEPASQHWWIGPIGFCPAPPPAPEPPPQHHVYHPRKQKAERRAFTSKIPTGLWIGPRLAGGGAAGVSFSWLPDQQFTVDLGLSLRPAVRDLEFELTVVGSAGLSWQEDQGLFRQGVFATAGSSVPGLDYYDSYVAGGYHHRLHNGRNDHAWQFRAGVGVLPYGSYRGYALGVRPMLYLSTSWLFLASES